MFRLRPTPSATFARLCRFFWAASSTWTIADALSAFMRSILAATAICTSAICEPTKAVAIDTGSIPVPFLRQVYQRNVNATGGLDTFVGGSILNQMVYYSRPNLDR